MTQVQFKQIQSILQDFSLLLTEHKTRQKQTAPDFNIFDALGVERDEHIHSRFLAYLLNPKGRHGQGESFLTSFLQTLVSMPVCPAATKNALVYTEASLDSAGRIDLYIRLEDGQIVLIENKVDAAEGVQQLTRYQTWLREHEPVAFTHRLVFLTPCGRPPSTADTSKGEIICLSYPQLANWLDACGAQTPERLEIILKQYAELCRRIGGQ